MKKKQKKQAELLEKRIQEMEGEALLPEGGEDEDDEEEVTTTTTESTEDTTSSATVSLSATLQDIASHAIGGGPSHTHKHWRTNAECWLSDNKCFGLAWFSPPKTPVILKLLPDGNSAAAAALPRQGMLMFARVLTHWHLLWVWSYSILGLVLVRAAKQL